MCAEGFSSIFGLLWKMKVLGCFSLSPCLQLGTTASKCLMCASASMVPFRKLSFELYFLLRPGWVRLFSRQTFIRFFLTEAVMSIWWTPALLDLNSLRGSPLEKKQISGTSSLRYCFWLTEEIMEKNSCILETSIFMVELVWRRKVLAISLSSYLDWQILQEQYEVYSGLTNLFWTSFSMREIPSTSCSEELWRPVCLRPLIIRLNNKIIRQSGQTSDTTLPTDIYLWAIIHNSLYNIYDMLYRNLRRACCHFSKEKETPKPAAVPEEYLVFPTKRFIFPYYIYTTRINKHLYNYINRNNINYTVALAVQPGVARKELMPTSIQHMEKELKLKPNPNPTKAGETPSEIIEIRGNNLILEGFSGHHEKPVYYVDSLDQVYPIGSLCRLVTSHDKDIYTAHLRADIRFEVNAQGVRDSEGPLMYLSGRTLKNENLTAVGGSPEYKALTELHAQLIEISRVNLPDIDFNSVTKSLELMGGYLCTMVYFTSLQLYQVFSTINMVSRAGKLVEFYQDYVANLLIQWNQLNEQNKQAPDEQDQKQHLRKVYENSRAKLGHEKDMKYIRMVKKKLSSGRYPEAIVKQVECELSNIQELGQGNPEIHRKKHFLNLLIDYPFGIVNKEEFDIKRAKQILDADHYGMKKVKQRILEFIAVSKIKGEFRSKVLLLHGPPGVGKTSIVKSIAKCLNRPYGRISLGGEYEAQIMKGHRKTYVGAYPGRIFDTIFKAKTENPVILLDEIDKIQPRQGRASLQDVIMEVLDPIQNHKFKDDFMDVEIDLSKVLFICTANSLDTIFPPLLDRLERMEVSGYTTGEKKKIFSQYIIQNSIENTGLPQEVQKHIEFTDQGLHAMIEGYCKEAGVRNLVRKTNKIFNKMALEYVRDETFDRKITPDTLKKYLGLPKFRGGRFFQSIPPKGVMIGLAYNAYGGSIMYIEAAASNIRKESESTEENKEQIPKGHLLVTGNIKDVMSESTQLAYSYAKYITSNFFNNRFLEINDIHLNFPEIEIGKDGPSAGVAITCTLVSLALNKPAHKEIAMTGEITLSGDVSAIGGVKEKTMGAKREGIYELIFPEQNRRDVEELEDEIKEGMTFHFASHFFQVMDLVFGLKITETLESQGAS